MFGRIAAFLYGIACYLVFFASFLYAIAFLGDFPGVKSIDSGPQAPLGQALGINIALLGLFAAQHSIMARPWFKRLWTRIIAPAVERSTYVLFASLALALLFWQWQPMGGVVWDITDAGARFLVYGIYAAGWILLLVATFLIDHFDLFGLRQVFLHLTGRPYTGLRFRTPGFYRYVRHPIYFSWLCIFWAAPRMTMAHLIFALATTAYMLMAIPWEERDLIGIHGEAYRLYRRQVPGILPVRLRRKQQPEAVTVSE